LENEQQIFVLCVLHYPKVNMNDLFSVVQFEIITHKMLNVFLTMHHEFAIH